MKLFVFLLLMFAQSVMAYEAVLSVNKGGTGTSSIATGGICFSSGSQITTDTANLYFDNAANQLLLGAGSVSAPPLSKVGDTNTGIYFPSSDAIALTAGGYNVVQALSSGVLSVQASGSVTVPVITRQGDTNTGLYWPTTDQIALTAGGTQVLRAEAGGVTISGTGGNVPHNCAVQYFSDTDGIHAGTCSGGKWIFGLGCYCASGGMVKCQMDNEATATAQCGTGTTITIQLQCCDY